MEKPLKNPLIGTDKKRKAKKGNSTPKVKKNRTVARFYDVKIRITADEYTRGLPYFDEPKYLAKFTLESYREKIKRAEAHDKEARQRILVSNMDLLEPVIKEMFVQGKLSFLNGLTQEPVNG